jgi:hypothetical protein
MRELRACEVTSTSPESIRVVPDQLQFEEELAALVARWSPLCVGADMAEALEEQIARLDVED